MCPGLGKRQGLIRLWMGLGRKSANPLKSFFVRITLHCSVLLGILGCFFEIPSKSIDDLSEFAAILEAAVYGLPDRLVFPCFPGLGDRRHDFVSIYNFATKLSRAVTAPKSSPQPYPCSKTGGF
jgi:hypothetical protein